MSAENLTHGIGYLAKPINTLIEKISDAIGWVAEPHQIKRIAKAEAEALLIAKNAHIQASDIERRGLARMIKEEGQKQQNIENIIEKALTQISQDAEPEKIEKDWLVHFFDLCKLVSDEDMQSIWARILAGQANKSGSFSKKTIETVNMLDKNDAVLFTQLCTFVWLIGYEPIPLILDEQITIFNKAGINFPSLKYLEEIGLVNIDNRGFISKIDKYLSVSYYSQAIKIEFPNRKNIFQLGKVRLTRTGKELFSICKANASKEYFSYMQESWLSKKYILSIPTVS